MARTATTSNAILGLLALRPSWSAYALATQLRRNMRFFWPRAESRIYAELRNLVDQGAAESTSVTDGGRTRTIYAITPAGRERVREWLATPPRGSAFESEPVLRFLLGDLASAERLRAATRQIRADAEAVLSVGRVVAAEYKAGTAPFQDDVHLRAFVFDFLSSHALAMLDWAARTEAALEHWEDDTPDERARRGLALIEDRLGDYRPRPDLP